MSNALPKWVTNLRPDQRYVLADVSPIGNEDQPDIRVRDTLLIGVGPVGREVLSQVAFHLHARFPAKWPEKIRLLQIDVALQTGPAQATSAQQTISLPPPPGLTHEQHIVLRPNAARVRESLRRGEIAHWSWYGATAPGYDRSNGRLALFWDLMNGCDNSEIWRTVSATLQALNNPQVRVIGSTFDDASSGMLVDIVHLVHLMMDHEEDVQLWLSGPVGREWSERFEQRGRKIRVDEQNARTLATLREIERFQRNAHVPFHYVGKNNLQEQLRRTTRTAVIQTVILFEGSANYAPEDDVFASMADCLSAFFDEDANAKLTNALKVNRDKVGYLSNRSAIGSVAAMGGASLRSPGRLLSEALSWRLVYDCLFEAALGITPVSRLHTDSGGYEPIELIPGSLDPAHTRMSAQERRSEVEDLVTRLALGHLDLTMFFQHVENRVEDLMNGDDTVAINYTMRGGGVNEAVVYLEALRATLRRSGQTQPLRGVDSLIEQIENWRTTLRAQTAPKCAEQLSAAQQRLKQIYGQPTRVWSNLRASLEFEQYRASLRPWASAPPSPGSPLLRMAARFGWRVTYRRETNQFDVQFLVFPPDFVASKEAQPGLDAFAVPRDPSSILRAIYQLALPLASIPSRLSANDLITLTSQTNWPRQSEVRLKFDEMTAAERTGGEINYVGLLITPSLEQRDRLLSFIRTNANGPIPSLEACLSSDQTSVTLVRLATWVPLADVAAYAEAAWKARPVPSSLYVWRAEQLAASLEGDERISAQFLAYLEQDAELARSFALGFAYGIYETDDKWVYLGQGGKLAIGDGSPGTVFEALFDPTRRPIELASRRDLVLRDWNDAVRSARGRLQAQGRRKSYLKEFSQETLHDLYQSGSRLEKDLAIYIGRIIEQD